MKYKAMAIHSKDEGGIEKFPCEIEISPSLVKLNISEEPSQSIKFEDLHFYQGGAANKLIFLEQKNKSEWSFYTQDKRILKELKSLPGHQAGAQSIIKNNQKHKGRTIILISLIIAFLFSITQIPRVLPHLLVKKISPEHEMLLGDKIINYYLASSKVLNSKEINNSLKKLTDELMSEIDLKGYKIRFHLINNPEVNAFAFPGGHIVIHSGLVKAAKSSEEVLGVLAHELAHITKRHILRNILSRISLVTLVQLLFGDVAGLTAIITSNSEMLYALKFSRDFEREADEAGFHYLLTKGIDPVGMLDFFKSLAEKQKKMNDKIKEQTNLDIAKYSFLSTHPNTEERIENIKGLMSRYIKNREFRAINFDLEKFKEEIKNY